MQHLVAEPRTRKGILVELRMQPPVLGEHRLLRCACGLHSGEMFKERTPPIGMIEADEDVSARLYERVAKAFECTVAVIRVVQHTHGDDDVNRLCQLETKQIGDFKDNALAKLQQACDLAGALDH